MEKPSRSFFSEWLEKIQQESWQLELLISGFAIFGLFEFKNYLDVLETQFSLGEMSGMLTFYLYSIFGLVYTGTIVFIWNLLIHVGVRGLWIGAIGLRYVSGEIEYDQLKYQDRFVEFYRDKIGSFDAYIEKLERFASLVFSFTFLLFFLILSGFFFLLYMVACMHLITLISQGETEASAYTLGFTMGDNVFLAILVVGFLVFHIVFGLVVFLDFVSLGAIKGIRSNWFSRIYFWIYRYFGWITLSFLFRPLLLNYLDNSYTKKFLLFSIPYIFIVAIFLPELSYQDKLYFPSEDFFKYDRISDNESVKNDIIRDEYYADARSEFNLEKIHPRLPVLSIPSKIISESVLELYIQQHSTLDKYIMSNCPTIKPFQKKGIHTIFTKSNLMEEDYQIAKEQLDRRLEMDKQSFRLDDKMQELSWYNYRDSLKNVFRDSIKDFRLRNLQLFEDVFKERVSVSIDGEIVAPNNLDCGLYQHPSNEEAGLLCFVDLKYIKKGMHELTVDQKSYELIRDTFINKNVTRNIPFYYAPK